MEWSEGLLTQADIHSDLDGQAKIKYHIDLSVTKDGQPVEYRIDSHGCCVFRVETGGHYQLKRS